MTTRKVKRLIMNARKELRRQEFQERARHRRERAERVGEGGRWIEHERVNCGTRR